MTTADGRTRLSWAWLVVALVVYALVPAFFSVIVLGSDEIEDTFPSASSIFRERVGDASLSVVIVAVLITLLGWWAVVRREERRAQRWVWIVPGTIVAASLAFVDYGRLREGGPALVAMLALAVLLIGVNEELMFRGVVLRTLRDRYPEAAAAIATAVVFGAFHLVQGPLNALASCFAGYLFYATRRVSGGIVAPILVHAIWDFSLFSTWTTSERAESPNGPLVLFLISVALVVLLVVKREAFDVPAHTTAAD